MFGSDLQNDIDIKPGTNSDGLARMRSHHFFGRLRLWKSEFTETISAPTKLGRPRL